MKLFYILSIALITAFSSAAKAADWENLAETFSSMGATANKKGCFVFEAGFRNGNQLKRAIKSDAFERSEFTIKPTVEKVDLETFHSVSLPKISSLIMEKCLEGAAADQIAVATEVLERIQTESKKPNADLTTVEASEKGAWTEYGISVTNDEGDSFSLIVDDSL